MNQTCIVKWATLDMFLKLSKPQLLYLQDGDGHNTSLSVLGPKGVN